MAASGEIGGGCSLLAHDAGPRIRARIGLWLAIPTATAGKALRGRRITPAAWERKTGLRLRFLYRGG